MEIDAVKTSYARWAPIYDRTFGAVTDAGRRKAVQYINRQEGTKVLEVGVRTGLALTHYRSDLKVTGIDFNEDMLTKARGKVRDLDLRQVESLDQMDARHLGFPDCRNQPLRARNRLPGRGRADLSPIREPIGVALRFRDQYGSRSTGS